MVTYLATPVINNRYYGKRRAPRSSHKSCRVLRKFVFLILFFTGMEVISLCNLVYMYIRYVRISLAAVRSRLHG